MRPTLTGYTQALACAAALLTLAACGGDADGEKTSASSSSTSSEPTYDDDYAYAQAEKVQTKVRGIKPNEPIPKGATWATRSYIKAYNEDVADQKNAGVVERGSVTVDAMHPLDSNPEAPGGWDLTMYQCSTSTVRYFKDGEDVTARPEDPNKPMPSGPQKNVHLLSFKTPDDGRTWQIDNAQLVYGAEVKETPCASD